MNTQLERLYYRLPVLLQNVAVSLMGWKLYRERYNKEAQVYEAALARTELMLGVELKLEQEKSFVEMARHAIEQVPYYREWAAIEGISVGDIQSLDDLRRFPILEKEQLRKNPESFLADNYKYRKDLFKLNTSGTTGTPLTLFCDKNSRSHHYAFFSRLRGWYGLNKNSRRATLFGRIILLPEQDKPPFWRYDLAQKNLLMSSYHLGDKNLRYYYEKLMEYKADEIFAYPSSILPIAKYIVEKNLPKVSLKLLMTTAEPLFDYQREILKKAFDAPIVNQYGCTEMAFFVAEDRAGIMRFHPEHGIAEVENEEGHIASFGKGELVATGLVNMAMPLIRYRVGDTVELSAIATSAGTDAYPQLISIEGRTDDLLYRRDGTAIGRLDPVFKGGGNIKSAQIIQQQNGNIDVLIDVAHQFSVDDEDWLISELKKRVGKDISVNIYTDKDIEKSANGKFKAVVSNYNRDEI